MTAIAPARTILIPRDVYRIGARQAVRFDTLEILLRSRPPVPDPLSEAFDPLQPRVPKGNPTGGRWIERGSAAASEFLDRQYADIRPELDRLTEQFVGSPGEVVQIEPDDWTAEQRVEMFDKVVDAMALTHDYTRQAEFEILNGFVPDAAKSWVKADLERQADERGLTGQQRELFLSSIHRTNEGVKDWLATTDEGAEMVRAMATSTASEDLNQFISYDDEALAFHARELGVPFPTTTIGGTVELGPSEWTDEQRNDLSDKVIAKRVEDNPYAIQNAKDNITLDEIPVDVANRIYQELTTDERLADRIAMEQGAGSVNYSRAARQWLDTEEAADLVHTVAIQLEIGEFNQYNDTDNQYLQQQAREWGVPLPTINTGTPVPYLNLPETAKHQILEEYLKRTPLSESDIAAGTKNGVFNEQTARDKQAFDFIASMSDEQRAAALSAAGIQLPSYSRVPIQYRPYSPATNSLGDAQDYNRSHAIAVHLQTERGVQLANQRLAETGISLQVDATLMNNTAEQLWGAWKSNSGSDLGMAMQEAVYEELHSHHRRPPGSLEKARRAFRAIGLDVLMTQGGQEYQTALTNARYDHDRANRMDEFIQALPPEVTSDPSKMSDAIQAGARLLHITGVENIRTVDQWYEKSQEIEQRFNEMSRQREQVGRAVVRAHVRSTWEVSQYMLDKAGVRNEPIETYRGLILDHETIARADPVTTALPADRYEPGGPYELTRLPGLRIDRNGAQSTTRKLEQTANTWEGVGVHLDERVNDRVILRMAVPATAVLSLPVFGQNVYEEEEIVITGNHWGNWDAWRHTAPRIAKTRAQHIRDLMFDQGMSRQAAEATADNLVLGHGGTLEQRIAQPFTRPT